MSASDRISPTAHYTAEVWRRNALSPDALATPTGRVLYRAMTPLNALYRRRGHRTIEDLLLTRHRLLDQRVRAAVASGRIGQVIELAAGLSGRGMRIAGDHPELVYIESDLPAMSGRKRAMLERGGLRPANLAVTAVDALDDGALEQLAARLDPARGLAIITEGLLPYLSRADVDRLWRRIATVLGRFDHGLYFADLSLRNDADSQRASWLFQRLLRTFVRGDVRLHFDVPAAAERALHDAGFADVTIEPRTGPDNRLPDGQRPVVRVIQAAPAVAATRPA